MKLSHTSDGAKAKDEFGHTIPEERVSRWHRGIECLREEACRHSSALALK